MAGMTELCGCMGLAAFGVFEFTYTGGTWNKTYPAYTQSDIWSLAIGNGRNDGVKQSLWRE